MARLTHCPHCGEALFDERLTEQGWPRIGSEWELDAEGGPVTKLTVLEVEPGNRLGREIRGTITYRTQKNGTEYAPDASTGYATDYETFNKTWNYKGRKDLSKMKEEIGSG